MLHVIRGFVIREQYNKDSKCYKIFCLPEVGIKKRCIINVCVYIFYKRRDLIINKLRECDCKYESLQLEIKNVNINQYTRLAFAYRVY